MYLPPLCSQYSPSPLPYLLGWFLYLYWDTCCLGSSPTLGSGHPYPLTTCPYPTGPGSQLWVPHRTVAPFITSHITPFTLQFPPFVTTPTLAFWFLPLVPPPLTCGLPHIFPRYLWDPVVTVVDITPYTHLLPYLPHPSPLFTVFTSCYCWDPICTLPAHCPVCLFSSQIITPDGPWSSLTLPPHTFPL